jgi:raffinose/stachyose/melibiose transport system permease protein
MLVTDVILSLPAFIGYTLIFALPVFVGLYYSLTDWDGIGKSYNFIGMQNYIDLITDKRVLDTIALTLKYTGMLVICVLVISMLTALVLNSKPFGWRFFKAWFFVPCLFSLITTGLLFKELFADAIPLLGQILENGPMSKNLLTSSKTAIYAVLFVNVWGAVCLPTVLLFAALKSVPQYLYEVADLDGAGAFVKFRVISVPYILPTISMVLLTTLKGGLSMYEYSLVLTSGGPGRATQTVTYLIYEYGFETHKYAYASALSFVMLIFMVLISVIYYTRVASGKDVDES